MYYTTPIIGTDQLFYIKKIPSHKDWVFFLID